MSGMIFERKEIKYLLSREQAEAFRALAGERLQIDEYGKSLLLSLYFDTPDQRLIAHSLQHPVYKEKLRLRSYGIPEEDTTVYLELKKKYAGIVYKRRIALPYREAKAWIRKEGKLPEGQIGREIEYFRSRYEGLMPKACIAYQREAFTAPGDPDLRVTFDTALQGRESDLSLDSEPWGKELIKEDQVLLEIKAAHAFPLWLVRILSAMELYKISFSKYGTLYRMKEKEEQRGPLYCTELLLGGNHNA